MKTILKNTLFLSLLSAASISFAQLPELSTPTTATGTETTAVFLGGATADNGATYANSFAFDAPIDIDLEIQVEAGHVNTVGNIYVIIVWEGSYFVLDENGAYQLWDLSVENFLAAFPGKTLQSSEPINIVNDVAFGPAGVSDTTMDFIIAYDTMAVANEFFYNGIPLSVTIEEEVEEEPPVAQSLQIFTDSISGPIIQGNCIACHTGSGAAGSSALLYATISLPSFLQVNYTTLVDYINQGNSATLLSKPTGGSGHGGGVRLQASSTDFQNLEAFVNAVLAE
ncbi:MAG: hypothetical protein GKR91_11315 [Pseudomonadales bacterium]|nr:hypothetical protein [Pseudomonadales bacterium]